jgi:hypothetical protein
MVVDEATVGATDSVALTKAIRRIKEGLDEIREKSEEIERQLFELMRRM